MRSRMLSTGVLLATIMLVVAACAAVTRDGTQPGPLPAATAAFPTILQDDAALLHRPPQRIEAALAEASSLGVDVVRLTAGWSVIAPEPGSPRRPRFDASDPAAYPAVNWRNLDRAVRMAHARGLQVMIDIAFWAPRWAVSRPVDELDRQRWGIRARPYAEFAAAVARRYSGRYAGLPAARWFTVWNEPNFGTFLMPQWQRDRRGRWRVASADVYREMLYAAVPAIRAAAPAAKVLIGGLAPTGTGRPRRAGAPVAPLRFLRALACVDESLRPERRGGCRDFRPLPGDGFAHHPYSVDLPPWEPDPDPDNVRMADLPRLVDLLRALHAAGRTEARQDVWITEFGYQTNPPDPTWRWGTLEQSRMLARAEQIAATTDGVRSFAQFLLFDLPERPGPTLRSRWGDYQSGLRFPDGRPKPALRTFATPVVVERAGEQAVRIWARVRPGTGARDVRIAARRPREREWRPVGGTLRTDERGIVERELPGEPGAHYRVEVRDGDRWRAGAPSR